MSRHPSSQPVDPDVRFGRAWRDHHRYVLDVAFRTLGNLGEAEDVVQEAYARLLRVDLGEIADVRGWLVVAVGRLCIDRLRYHQRRPVSPDGTVSPESPARVPGGEPDPADRVTLDDSVRLALHLMLERLTPAERTTFVLHDVFRFSFEEVAEIVGRTPVACRQLASRARRSIRDEVGPSRFSVESPEERQVTERFIAACATGDLDGLLVLLDPDVAGDADLGPGAPAQPAFVGRQAVARSILRFFGPDTSTTLLSLPARDGEPAVVAFHDHQVFAAVSIHLRDGLIDHLHALVDPAVLGRENRS